MTNQPTNADIQESVETLRREVDLNPTNAEILKEVHEGKEALINHTADDHRIAQSQADVNKEMKASLAALHIWKKQLPDIIRAVFAEELKNFFKITGLNTKTVIVTAGLIIGSLTVIFGGFKTLLAWIGFSLIK